MLKNDQPYPDDFVIHPPHFVKTVHATLLRLSLSFLCCRKAYPCGLGKGGESLRWGWMGFGLLFMFLCLWGTEAQAHCVWKKQSFVRRVGSCMQHTFKGKMTQGKFSLKVHASALYCGGWKLDFITRIKTRAKHLCRLAKSRSMSFRWVHTIKVIRSWEHYVQIKIRNQRDINQAPTVRRTRRVLVDSRNGKRMTFATIFPQKHTILWSRLQKQFKARPSKEQKVYACSQRHFSVVRKAGQRYVRFDCYGKKGVYRDNFISLDVALSGLGQSSSSLSPSSQPTSQQESFNPHQQRAKAPLLPSSRATTPQTDLHIASWYKRCADKLALEFMQYPSWRALLQLPGSLFWVGGGGFRLGETAKERTLWYVRHTLSMKSCSLSGVNTGKVSLKLQPEKLIPGCGSQASFTLSYFAGHLPLLLLQVRCNSATRHVFLRRKLRKWVDVTTSVQPKISVRLHQVMRRLSLRSKRDCHYNRIAFLTTPSRFALHMYATSDCKTNPPPVKIASFLWKQGRFSLSWIRKNP